MAGQTDFGLPPSHRMYSSPGDFLNLEPIDIEVEEKYTVNVVHMAMAYNTHTDHQDYRGIWGNGPKARMGTFYDHGEEQPFTFNPPSTDRDYSFTRAPLVKILDYHRRGARLRILNVHDCLLLHETILDYLDKNAHIYRTGTEQVRTAISETAAFLKVLVWDHISRYTALAPDTAVDTLLSYHPRLRALIQAGTINDAGIIPIAATADIQAGYVNVESKSIWARIDILPRTYTEAVREVSEAAKAKENKKVSVADVFQHATLSQSEKLSWT